MFSLNNLARKGLKPLWKRLNETVCVAVWFHVTHMICDEEDPSVVIYKKSAAVQRVDPEGTFLTFNFWIEYTDVI